MRTRTLLIVAAALTASGCQTTSGPMWSEVTGVRYHRAAANRQPATIVAIGDQPVFRVPWPVAPGTYRITVESPWHDGFPGTIRDIELKLEPCRRYYINAQFAGTFGQEWKPVIDETVRIEGCRISTS